MDIKHLALITAIALSGTAFAQQPGSAAYNSRVLPAHGLGDTRQEVLSWGAAAMGSNNFLGLSSNAADERNAIQNALRNCRNRGGVDCEITAVYANGCIAIAVNDDSGYFSTGPDLETAKRKAMAGCEGSCELFRDECSFPN